MPPARDDTRRKALFAAVCAGLAISSQTAGKAARDAIFLGQFHVTRLPALLVLSSLLSIAAALGIARAMTQRSPVKLIPVVNVGSAALLLVEWWLLRLVPGPAAIVVYVHQAVLGAILVSGFWSVISETFDPRSARKVMGTVGAGATLGGIVGAVIAERAAVLLGAGGVLPVLAVLQLAAAGCLTILAGRAPATATDPSTTATAVERPLAVADTLRNLVRVALLRQLAILVVLGTVAAAMLDYVFKARASAAFSGDDLLRFFAAFYGGVGVLTALVQWMVGRVALERWGLARTIGALPVAVAGFSAAALAVPGLPTTVAARASENVLRNSLYRQAYEALYTPLPAQERRSTKTVVDVGVERVGDAVGGALVALVLLAGAAASAILLGGAVALSLAGVWVARRVQRSYVEALERGLVARAIELDLDEVRDRTSRETLMQTMHRVAPLESSVIAMPVVAGKSAVPTPAPPRAASEALDPLLARAAALRSGDAAAVRAALAGPLPPALVAHVIPLLAWDDVAGEATQTLNGVASRAVGQLVDALLDPDEEFAVRRRLPRVLATANGARAGQGLLLGLADRRFEVRFRCARALARLLHREPDLIVDGEQVFAAVQRELGVDEQTWKHLSVLDEERDVDTSIDTPLVDEVLRDRANRGLEHVFTLLTLVLPAEPIRIAFRALHTTDKSLRGTALEYLEEILPAPVKEKLWPQIDVDALPRAASRPRAEVESALLESRAAVNVSLEALRREEHIGH
jgi:hypothetical protein